MSAIITIVAHDITCKKGDEWVCHSMAENKEDSRGVSDATTEDKVESAKIGIAVACIPILIGICIWIYHLITR